VPAAVISHALARSAFGSPDAAIGKTIVLNSLPFTVVGVADASFGGISTTGGIDVWYPGSASWYLRHVEGPRLATRTHGIFYEFVVRAAPGATFTDVDTELKVLARQLAERHPGENEKFATVAPRVFPGLGLPPLMRPSTRRMVNVLLAVGGVLLLLGCANVANLLVFRVARREQEVAIRKALGASRARLLQLQLTEGWLLSIGGAALGLLLAVYLKQVIEQLLFPTPPGMSFSVPIDRRVLALTVSLALTTGTLAALAPAWLVTRTRGLAALARATVTSRRAPMLRGGIAVLQLALSVTLLIGALLLVTTLRNLRAVDLGLDPDRVTVVGVELGDHGYDAARALAYHRDVLPALRAVGDFEGVTLAGLAPFGSSSSIRILPGEGRTSLQVRVNGVADNYFALLSIPIVRGRTFTEAEAAGGGDGTPLIVNETLARQLYGTLDVVGRTVRFARTGLNAERDYAIVGVARDSRWRSITESQDPFMYQPFGHFVYRVTRGVYLIKSDQGARRAGEVANVIAARTARSVPLSPPRPLTDGLDRELSEQRTFAWMLSLLAALGFGLAALGLYGLVAQATVERRREFGIRLALGAAAGDIVRLVARYAAVVSGIGVLLGMALAWSGARVIKRMLFGVSPLEPSVYMASVATLVLVVALACAGPTWRALSVRAVDVLRAE
jgi:predicted permease